MKENNYISEERKKKNKKKRKLFESGKSGPSKSAVQIMNGDFLTRGFFVNNLSYIFFVVFLLILLVTKGYYVNYLANDIARTEKEVGDMMADYVEKKAALEEMTRRTELIEQLRPMGLKETINPTKVIRVKEKEK